MAGLRISVVQYLNTAPLVRGFTHGPLRGKYDLSFTVPSRCAEALRTGAADIAIIPAIEYQRIPGLSVLPGLSIAAREEVRSLLLVSRKPAAEAAGIALDQSSRSTQAFVKILAAKHWKSTPLFTEAPPDAAAMLEKAEAALLIGDPALRLAVRIEREAERRADGSFRCPAEAAGIACGGTLFIYDVVREWRNLTALPAVMAFWAARPSALTPEVAADFEASLAFGMARLGEIAEEAAPQMDLPAAALESYLRDNIDFTLGEENRRGLELYYRMAAELGLIPEARPVAWSSAP